MAKIRLGASPEWVGGPKSLAEPAFVPLIGTYVDGKPNFMTDSWRGWIMDAGIIRLGTDVRRYTHKGITQNMTFSFNVPSFDLRKEAEYCGTVSGRYVNKAEVCKFKLFYGKLGTAPMIEQCPLNLECSVKHIVLVETHSMIIGQIERAYISEDCLTNGKPDINKIKALYFARADDAEGRVHHPFMSFGVYPDDPQRLVDATGMALYEHHGIHALDKRFGTDDKTEAPPEEFTPASIAEWEVKESRQ